MWIIIYAVCIAATVLFIYSVRSMTKDKNETFYCAMWTLATTLDVRHTLDKNGPMNLDEIQQACELTWWEAEAAIDSLIKSDCIIVNEKGEYQVKEEK